MDGESAAVSREVLGRLGFLVLVVGVVVDEIGASDVCAMVSIFGRVGSQRDVHRTKLEALECTGCW